MKTKAIAVGLWAVTMLGAAAPPPPPPRIGPSAALAGLGRTGSPARPARKRGARRSRAGARANDLIAVKSFESFRLVGIGVSHEGRVFASAPSARGGNKVVEVDTKTGAVTPYPNAAWNTTRAQPTGESEWVVAQAMWVDTANRLWVLDTGRGAAPPKLVEFDLATNRPLRIYGFAGVVAPPDALNDVRVDLAHGDAYLTNAGNHGSLVVLDLKTGRSRQVLVNDRSTRADPAQHLMLNTVSGATPALGADGRPVSIQADGIALSPDAAWLYYRPLTDHHYWRVPTAALRDPGLSPAALAQKVEYLGDGPMSGGLIMDRERTLYGGDLEHAQVAAMTMDPTMDPATHRLHSRVFAAAPGRLSWADGFAISAGWLYIADSHLSEIAFQNHLPRSGPLTIFRVKLPE